MSGRIPWSFLAPQLILFLQCKQEHMKKLNFYPISITWEWHQNGMRKHRWHRTYVGTSQGPFECKPFLQYIGCAYIPPLNSEHWPVSPERQDCSGRSPTCCTLPGESSRRAAAGLGRGQSRNTDSTKAFFKLVKPDKPSAARENWFFISAMIPSLERMLKVITEL